MKFKNEVAVFCFLFNLRLQDYLFYFILKHINCPCFDSILFESALKVKPKFFYRKLY